MTSPTDQRSHNVLVFSQDPAVREAVRTAVGRRPARDLGRINYIECATGDEVVARVDSGRVDLAILDGEAQPTGGMGISRQLKNEIVSCPPICVLLGRRDDRWLATWSQADATVALPLDPVIAARTVADLLRARSGGTRAVRPVAR